MNEFRCNCCGRKIEYDGSVYTEDALFVTKEWGYFSHKDGVRHKFCLCETCYDKITDGFAIPVEAEDVTEYI